MRRGGSKKRKKKKLRWSSSGSTAAGGDDLLKATRSQPLLERRTTLLISPCSLFSLSLSLSPSPPPPLPVSRRLVPSLSLSRTLNVNFPPRPFVETSSFVPSFDPFVLRNRERERSSQSSLRKHASYEYNIFFPRFLRNFIAVKTPPPTPSPILEPKVSVKLKRTWNFNGRLGRKLES